MAAAPHARTITVIGAGGLAALSALAPAGAVPASAAAAAPAASYSFRTLDNGHDPTFNQLLGINDHGKIAGYYGSGAHGHANKGYVLLPPYRQADYRAENFPNSAQTQVTGLNDVRMAVGFFSRTNRLRPAANAYFGFWARRGHFHKVVFPAARARMGKSMPPVDQLLGINNAGEAIGFYLDSAGNAHGYLYNVFTRKFVTIPLAGAVSLTGTGINNKNAVVGFFNKSTGKVKSFYITQDAQVHVHILAFPGADLTQAFGVNNHGKVVGAYTIGARTFGFTWTVLAHFRTVSDPHGPGTTVVNGVNNAGALVGFFIGPNGNTHGMLARP